MQANNVFYKVDEETKRELGELIRIEKLNYYKLQSLTGVPEVIIRNVVQNKIEKIKTQHYLKLVKFCRDHKEVLAKEKA